MAVLRNSAEKASRLVRKREAHAKPGSSRPRRAEEDLTPFYALTLDMLCIAGIDGFFMYLNPA